MFFPAERPSQTATDRLLGVISGLGRVLFLWQSAGWMTAWMVRAISERSNGIGREIRMLVTAFRAGTLRTRRSPPPGCTRLRPEVPAAPAVDPAMRLPRGPGWLVRLMGWHVAPFGGQLLAVLNDPEMQDLLAASPRAVRALKPLCRMLGVALPLPVPPVPVPPAASPLPEGDDRPLRRRRRRRPSEKRWRGPSRNPPLAREVARSDGGGDRPFKNRAGFEPGFGMSKSLRNVNKIE